MKDFGFNIFNEFKQHAGGKCKDATKDAKDGKDCKDDIDPMPWQHSNDDPS